VCVCVCVCRTLSNHNSHCIMPSDPNDKTLETEAHAACTQF